MQVPLQIAFHHVESDEAVKDLIEEKVAWLESRYGRVTGCRVVVERPNHRPDHDGPYRVRINLAVPGSEVNVTRDPHRDDADLDEAVRSAFDTARRQLEDYARRSRSG